MTRCDEVEKTWPQEVKGRETFRMILGWVNWEEGEAYGDRKQK